MNIVILSSNPDLYSTRRLVQSAKIRGHQVRVINHLKCFVMISDDGPAVYYKDELLTDIDAIIPRIGSSVTFYGTSILRQFELMGVFTTTKSASLEKSRDKLRSLQLLSSAGIGVPKTVFANDHKEINNLISMVGGAPLVVKLLKGTQGIGVVLAETPKAAKSIIEAFYGMDTDILIQEFIKESSGQDIRAFVVDGKVVGAMRRRGKRGEFRSNLHRGGAAEVIKLSRKEQEAAILAAKVLNLSVAGVDMLQSNRGPLIMEVNSSPGLKGIESATQIDIAGRIIDYIEKELIKGPKVNC